MDTKMRMIIGAIIVFIVCSQLITDQITGTDSGSTLITSVGYILLGVFVIYTLLPSGMIGKR